MIGSVSACGGGPKAATAPPATAHPTASLIPTTTSTSTATATTITPPTTPPSTVLARSTTTSTTKPAPTVGAGRLRGRTIALDPGHNGGDFAQPGVINQQVFIGNGYKACDTTGTAAADGYTEAAYNLDVATRLAALLRAAGATVVLTRTDNSGAGPCITQRAAIANQAHADAAISIHADGGPSVGRGFHVIEPAAVVAGGVNNTAIVAPSGRLALDVRRDYQAATGMPFSTYAGSSGLESRSDLGGLNLSTVPKVFIETGNMRNATDVALLESPDFRQKVALGLAQAFTDFAAGQ